VIMACDGRATTTLSRSTRIRKIAALMKRILFWGAGVA
jgi:20S proteasome alpha/beta subunit